MAEIDVGPTSIIAIFFFAIGFWRFRHGPTTKMNHNRQRRTAFATAVVAALRLLRSYRNHRDARFLPRSERKVHLPGGPVAAARLADRILEGSDERFYHFFRIDKATFWKLLKWLEDNTGFEPTKYQTTAQKLMIFLWICAYNEPQRNAAERFLCAQSTISDVFQTVLPRMVQLHQAFVKLPSDKYLSPRIEFDPKLAYFGGCIGAIDGTHIHAFIPAKRQSRWRNRKGWISQNVFAAVRFDGTFSYVLAGAEGSMHDSNLLGNALSLAFRVPKDRFYLGDGGFGQRGGIVVPFFEVRYHLQEWRSGDRRPETAKELYNLRHSRLRVIVEQVFGVLKRKWKIIRSSAPEYGFRTQMRIVYAVTGLHNFIRYNGNEAFDDEDTLTDDQRAFLELRRRRARSRLLGKTPIRIRFKIAKKMFRAYSVD